MNQVNPNTEFGILYFYLLLKGEEYEFLYVSSGFTCNESRKCI